MDLDVVPGECDKTSKGILSAGRRRLVAVLTSTTFLPPKREDAQIRSSNRPQWQLNYEYRPQWQLNSEYTAPMIPLLVVPSWQVGGQVQKVSPALEACALQCGQMPG